MIEYGKPKFGYSKCLKQYVLTFSRKGWSFRNRKTGFRLFLWRGSYSSTRFFFSLFAWKATEDGMYRHLFFLAVNRLEYTNRETGKKISPSRELILLNKHIVF